MQSVYYLKRLFVLIFFITPLFLFGQSKKEPLYEKDSIYVQTLLDLAYDLEIDDPDSAIQLYTIAAEIANEIDYKMGMGRAIQYTGIVQSDQGNYDKAIAFYLRAIEIFEEIPYPVGAASTYNNIGNIYKRKAEYAKALDNYIEGLSVFEQIGDTARLIYAYSNIGAVLSDVELYDKSLAYNEHSLQLSLLLKDSISICDGLINIGMIEHDLGLIDAAEVRFIEALLIAKEIQDLHILHLCYYNVSQINTAKNEVEEALINSKKGLAFAIELNNPALSSGSMVQCGSNFIALGILDSATYYLTESITLAEQSQAQETLILSYKWMAELQEKLNKPKESLYWFKKYQTIQEEATGNRQRRVSAGLEIEYESEKKDLELSEKALEIEKNEALLAKRNYLIITLLGALLSLFVLFFLIRRGLHQKKLIAEKEAQLQVEKIEQLKKKQQLIALESMIKGEEKERSRLAKDLHDGLGGMLSSTKMHFSSVAEENENIKASSSYTKAMELLDLTSIEARKISHNLMPGALEKYGLIEALKGFCESIGASDKLEVSFQAYGFEERLEANIEIMIYRIVLELVNNVLKHADATELLVQCMRNENQISITVEDNGKGFEQGSKENEGIGLLNIRSRVDYLNATLDIDSSIGKGSSIVIELQV